MERQSGQSEYIFQKLKCTQNPRQFAHIGELLRLKNQIMGGNARRQQGGSHPLRFAGAEAVTT
jgi:hypothetical protein